MLGVDPSATISGALVLDFEFESALEPRKIGASAIACGSMPPNARCAHGDD
jgi:hypothetical protein